MKSAIAIPVVLMAASLTAGETKLGAGVRVKEATPSGRSLKIQATMSARRFVWTAWRRRCVP